MARKAGLIDHRTDRKMCCRCYFKSGAFLGLIYIYFRCLQRTIQSLQVNVKNYPSSMLCQDSNYNLLIVSLGPWPLDRGFLPQMCCCCCYEDDDEKMRDIFDGRWKAISLEAKACRSRRKYILDKSICLDEYCEGWGGHFLRSVELAITCNISKSFWYLNTKVNFADLNFYTLFWPSEGSNPQWDINGHQGSTKICYLQLSLRTFYDENFNACLVEVSHYLCR